MKAGDFLEWRYLDSGIKVVSNETLYSSISNTHVPIGSNLKHILVSYDQELLVWKNHYGQFSARLSDDLAGQRNRISKVSILFHH